MLWHVVLFKIYGIDISLSLHFLAHLFNYLYFGPSRQVRGVGVWSQNWTEGFCQSQESNISPLFSPLTLECRSGA